MSMDFTCRQSLNPTPIAGWAGLWVSFFHLFFHGIFQSTRSFSSSFFSYLFLGLNNLSFHFGGGKIYFSWENFGRVLSSSSYILFWWWFHGYWVLSVTNREISTRRSLSLKCSFGLENLDYSQKERDIVVWVFDCRRMMLWKKLTWWCWWFCKLS